MSVDGEQISWWTRYYQKNRESILAKKRARRREDRDKENAYNAQWRKKNRPTANKYNREWVRANRPKRPWFWLVRSAKMRAKDRGLEYDLDQAWALSRWTGRCELTGIEFVMSSDKQGPYSPSLDRVDNQRGYTRDNCRFVLWAINRFKMNSTEEDMLRIAKAMVTRFEN